MNRKSIMVTIMLALVVTGLVGLSQSMNVQAEKYNGPNAYGSAHDKNHDGFTIQNIDL